MKGTAAVGTDEQTTIQDLRRCIADFIRERDWEQFHDPKNLAIALSIEATELQELFLWKSPDEVEQIVASKKGIARIREELADILIYLLYLSDSVGIDLSDAAMEKIIITRISAPITIIKIQTDRIRCPPGNNAVRHVQVFIRSPQH